MVECVSDRTLLGAFEFNFNVAIQKFHRTALGPSTVCVINSRLSGDTILWTTGCGTCCTICLCVSKVAARPALGVVGARTPSGYTHAFTLPLSPSQSRQSVFLGSVVCFSSTTTHHLDEFQFLDWGCVGVGIKGCAQQWALAMQWAVPHVSACHPSSGMAICSFDSSDQIRILGRGIFSTF